MSHGPIITNASDVRQSIGEVFNLAQKSTVAHNRCHEELAALFAKDRKQFERDFLQLLQLPMCVFASERFIERLLFEFVVPFVNDRTDDSFKERVLKFLASKCEAKDRAVRFRACQLLTRLLDNTNALG